MNPRSAEIVLHDLQTDERLILPRLPDTVSADGLVYDPVTAAPAVICGRGVAFFAGGTWELVDFDFPVHVVVSDGAIAYGHFFRPDVVVFERASGAEG